MPDLATVLARIRSMPERMRLPIISPLPDIVTDATNGTVDAELPLSSGALVVLRFDRAAWAEFQERVQCGFDFGEWEGGRG